ncbi:biotin/lipoyl-binding protein [Candidatus Gracilibacteria bacterium]|nr:biotin/lipoyl-binding protein [Candidatus Gracilibacteria bacterium]
MKRWIALLLTVGLLVGGGLFFWQNGSTALTALSPTAVPTLPPQAADLVVVADARVVPIADTTLNFDRSGTVVELFVAEGDAVRKGDPIARLDTRVLEVKVAQARITIEKAQANYEQLAAGAAPEAIAAAEASVSRAVASQQQVQGAVSGADIAAAQAQLAEARAALANVLDGPQDTAITQAQAALDQATINLSTQRSALSATKTNAELNVQQIANFLRDRQNDYSQIYWDNRELDDKYDDLPQERRDLEDVALRAVQNAEADLAQAQVGYEQARQAEIDGILKAESQVQDAQARYDQVIAGRLKTIKVAAARAKVVQAEARLANLRGAERAGALAVAAAGINQANAQLAEVAAPPRETELAAARVEIEAAKIALQQAELDVAMSTLYAPMAGTIVALNLAVGEVAAPSGSAVVLADLSRWRIETDDLTELDVVLLEVDAPVTISFALWPTSNCRGARPDRPAGPEPRGRHRLHRCCRPVTDRPANALEHDGSDHGAALRYLE